MFNINIENIASRSFDMQLGELMEIDRFLRIAVNLSGALVDLHEQHIVHRSFSPRSIQIDPVTNNVSIINTSETSLLHSSGQMLAYMSPEQTGRMNRVVDYRSDLYSLGVIFYQMATGSLPFAASDALEWVHCHIARIPLRAEELNPNFPASVSNIIMKLLAKTVEERYQTASGLLRDLEKCLTQLETIGDIQIFTLGVGDISHQMLIPQKLYGREHELAKLLNAFERVVASGIPELVLISGYSGIGKTSLVRELHKPVVNANGISISGKFDQYKGTIPYATFGEAFSEIVRHILSDSEEQITQWRVQLQSTLGINGRLISDIIPQIELIIGIQPPVPELPLSEAENRFNMVFQKFIAVFARREHPLVLFFDDLQWVDAASLKLLRHIICNPEMKYLLLIGAYRNNEVSPSHPLMMTLDNIEKETGKLNIISLSPLSKITVTQLIADTFSPHEVGLESLAGLIYEKTDGNPFFVTQFLVSLYEEKLVEFDRMKSVWKWDTDRINAKGYSDNVVDLMMSKMRKLPLATQNILELAACIGNTFSLDTLKAITVDDEKCSVSSALAEVIRERLLLNVSEDVFRFLHDRVQQAAYLLVPEEQRMKLHLQIARLMLCKAHGGSQDELTFDIANQFNCALALISDDAEKKTVAFLNLTAAKRAKESTAYQSALDYLLLASKLIYERDWVLNYQLAFDIYKELAEVEYLNSNYDRAKEIIEFLVERAQSNLEKARLYNILIVQYTLLAQYADAIKTGREALRLMNVNIPTTKLSSELDLELGRYSEMLGNRTISTLADEQEMSNPTHRVCLELLSNMVVPARYSDSDLFAVVILLNVNWSLQYGPTEKSTVGYSTFGMLLVSRLNSFAHAYQFGLVALKLSERFNALSQKCQSSFVLGHYLIHWVKHLRYVDATIIEGMQAGQASGEMQWTGYTMAYRMFPPFYRGERVEQVQSELPKLLHFTQKTRNQWATDTLNGFALALSELFTSNLNFEYDNETDYVAACQKRHSFGALGRYAVIKLQVHYMFGRMEEAFQAAETATGMEGFFSSSISVPALNFYQSLTCAALYDSTEPVRSKLLLERIRVAQQQMKIWKESCPENFQHHFLLVEAEIARIEGKDQAAMRLYEQSIHSAREHGFLQIEAIANELAGAFYERRELLTAANAYFRQAHSCYMNWGADRKVHHLENRFPWLASEHQNPKGDFENQIGHLDAISVIKASQSISREIVFDRLLETLMHIIMENAGAQKGCFLMMHGDKMCVEIEADVDGSKIRILPATVKPLSEVVPSSLCNYVSRTRAQYIVDDATIDELLVSDPYIQQNKPLSVLCLPLLRQGMLIGILYLENHLVRSAFSASRISVLEHLAAQAAISLENAQLYEERSRAEVSLKKSEEKYRQIFDHCGTALAFIEEDATLSMCNNEFEVLSGYSRSEAEGVLKWIDAVAYPEELQRMNEFHRLRRIDPALAPQAYEFHFLDKYGVIKDVVVTVTTIPGTNQSMAALLDITERKKAETERIRLVTAIEQSAEAIFITNTDWHIIYANQACQLVTGYTCEELIGKHTRIFKSGKHDRSFFTSIKNVLDSGEAWSGMMILKKKDGTFYDADATNAVVRDEAGNTINYVCTHRDVTRELRLERDLRQSQKMEAIGTLAGGIAHDFNNILTAVLGYADLAIRKMGDEAPASRDVRRVLEASSRAKDLVSQILTFSRQKEQEKEPVHVGEIVEEVFKLLRSSLPTTIEIHQHIQISSDSDMIMADSTQIHQVFMNLGTNAAHAMRDKGGILSVTLSDIYPDQALLSLYPDIPDLPCIRVSICDTGHGMDTITKERIFDPYFTTKKVGEGTGMGLAVVLGIVKSHGGYIYVYSESGAGTTFHLFFPKITSEVKLAGHVHQMSSHGGSERILFVDDEPILTEMGQDIFESLGYSITTTTSSIEALRILSEAPDSFDLVITDMTMPGLTGRELAERIMLFRPEIPIILCTGFSDVINEKQAEDLGIKAFVMKPYSINNLDRIVRKVLTDRIAARNN